MQIEYRSLQAKVSRPESSVGDPRGPKLLNLPDPDTLVGGMDSDPAPTPDPSLFS
jgi:hypothetical protein